MTQFTVEAVAGNRLSVSWSDAESRFSFLASINGDEMGDVLDRHGVESGANISKHRHEGGRGALTHQSATEAPYAAIVAEARAMINALGLVPKAVQERADRLAETERQRVKAKAAVMREELRGLAAILPADLKDAALAKAYDAIQNSMA